MKLHIAVVLLCVSLQQVFAQDVDESRPVSSSILSKLNPMNWFRPTAASDATGVQKAAEENAKKVDPTVIDPSNEITSDDYSDVYDKNTPISEAAAKLPTNIEAELQRIGMTGSEFTSTIAKLKGIKSFSAEQTTILDTLISKLKEITLKPTATAAQKLKALQKATALLETATKQATNNSSSFSNFLKQAKDFTASKRGKFWLGIFVTALLFVTVGTAVGVPAGLSSKYAKDIKPSSSAPNATVAS